MTGFQLDHDLTREIVKALGEGRLPKTDKSEIEIRHHYRVLFHEGFIGSAISPHTDYDHTIMSIAELEQLFPSLTGSEWFYLAFDGNEFLQNILDDKIWNKAKSIMGNAGTASLQIIVNAAVQAISLKIAGQL